MSVRYRFLLMLLPLSGCGEAKAPEPAHPVEAITVASQKRPVRLTYIGTTGAQAIKKYAFKMPGKIEDVFVTKGDRIKSGQPLARLDETEIDLSLEASGVQAKQARAAYREAGRFLRKMRKLKKAEAVSQLAIDKARLDYNMAKANHDKARLGLRSQKNIRQDATMISEVEGYVVEVAVRKGEVVAAGYPVVIVRNDTQVVNAGVSQRDIKKLALGASARVRVDDIWGEGTVTNISQIPDRQSRTYNVETSLNGKLAESAFYIGSIARVDFEVGDEEGIWIPISALLSDGIDHVFVADGDRAVRKNILLGPVDGSFVRVDGLATGDRLVVSGMRNLEGGYKVSVIDRTHDGGAANANAGAALAGTEP